MNLQTNRKKILLAAASILLLSLILPFRIPLVKILITLGVAWAAWKWAAPAEENAHSTFSGIENFRFSGGINEQRNENGARIFRCVFSSTVLDLTDVSSLPERIEIQTAFSRLTVRLPVDAAVTLHSSGAFCIITVPGQHATVFGENVCRCGTQDPNAPRIDVSASCAFASLSFKAG